MEARHASRTDLPRNQPANLPTFQRDVSWQCVGKHDGSPETYAAPETGAGCSVGAALHRCRLRFDRQRRPARRVKVDSAPDRRDTRVLGRWFGDRPQSRPFPSIAPRMPSRNLQAGWGSLPGRLFGSREAAAFTISCRWMVIDAGSWPTSALTSSA